MTKVFVIMSNVFPDKVFVERAAAAEYMKRKNEEDKRKSRRDCRARVYYGLYEMELVA